MEIFESGLNSPVVTYFETDETPTIAEFVDVLKGIDLEFEAGDFLTAGSAVFVLRRQGATHNPKSQGGPQSVQLSVQRTSSEKKDGPNFRPFQLATTISAVSPRPANVL